MRIKLNKVKISGIPEAEVAVSPSVLDNGMPQLLLHISAVGSYSKDVVGSLTLSPTEARELAARLVTEAEQAEALAAAKDPGFQPYSYVMRRRRL